MPGGVKQMNVLVTGAAGNVGSKVAEYLADQGMQVRATDTRMHPRPKMRLVIANLLDPLACYNLMDGIEAVVHLANHPHAHAAPFVNLYHENLTMTHNIFQTAIEYRLKKIVYISSIQAFTGRRLWTENPGPSGLPYLPLDSDMPQNPGNVYALSKCASEDMLRYVAKHSQTQCVALRLPWVASEKRHRSSQKNPEWPRHHINLDECLCYLLRPDVAALVHCILKTDLPGYRIYFPAAPETSYGKPAGEMLDEYYRNVPLRIPREQCTSLVDISRITADTGWKPQYSLHTESPVTP
ncbi:MAG: NAD(P)-dependent oxidoreductase [Phycisphaerales bacterium]|nr:NAD(P)-dependent oxidoreductase [Phycisphaerales bacterium]